MLLLGIVDFGMAMFAQNTIAHAAREGARYAVTHHGDTAGATSTARSRAVGLDASRLQVVASHAGERVRVEIDYKQDLITGGFLAALGVDPSLQLHAVATMQVE